MLLGFFLNSIFFLLNYKKLNDPTWSALLRGVSGSVAFIIWDRIVMTCELLQLPAPKIDLYEDSTRVTLFSEVPFSNISMEDKLWACYLHACIKHVQGEQMTNSSLSERFGVKESSSGSISRLIKEAVSLKLIKPLDPTTAPRYMKYLPIWA